MSCLASRGGGADQPSFKIMNVTKVRLEDLNSATAAEFTAALANVFEHSPWIAEAVAAARPFAGLAALRKALLGVVADAPHERRLALIQAHPDLASKTQRAAGLTGDSVSEQDGAGLDRLSDAEFAAFEAANNAYKAKFGFPFILCVRRHSKDSILDAFGRRLQNAQASEEQAALAEISQIASLRLAQLVEAPDTLPVHGRLSTHVLDTHGGRPAMGVRVELVELSRLGENRLIAKTVTNADGRTDTPLIHDRPLPIGRYELRFAIGDYFAQKRVVDEPQPFLDVVPVRFGIAEPEGHLHVPLLVTPWSYATYRGS
jgi:2-oxo-4-hydroxy-4-carboxy-5-ureidoimidazoline decarboxylase